MHLSLLWVLTHGQYKHLHLFLLISNVCSSWACPPLHSTVLSHLTFFPTLSPHIHHVTCTCIPRHPMILLLSIVSIVLVNGLLFTFLRWSLQVVGTGSSVNIIWLLVDTLKASKRYIRLASSQLHSASTLLHWNPPTLYLDRFSGCGDKRHILEVSAYL